MLIIVKSAPATPEGKRGVTLARDLRANIILLQNGVYFILEQNLEKAGFRGNAYVLDEDKRLRGLQGHSATGNFKDVDYEGFVDLITECDKVIGMF